MSFRTVLAHLSNERTAGAVLEAACALAERHGAHLIAVHVFTPIELYGPEVPMPEEVRVRYASVRAELAASLRARFDAAVAARDVVAEWRTIEHVPRSVAQSVVEIGDTTDLLVVGRGDDGSGRGGGGHERVLALSARPVLLLPDGDVPATLGQRVFVAWDGSREATGAVFGALPMLVRAEAVRLRRINPPAEDRRHAVGAGEDLAAHLARHGVKLEYGTSDAPAARIGAELLGFARDMEADTVVMGCYGHTRLRERLFGGTTRHVLEHADIPLLLQG